MYLFSSIDSRRILIKIYEIKTYKVQFEYNITLYTKNSLKLEIFKIISKIKKDFEKNQTDYS